jgi:hypothetical protein
MNLHEHIVAELQRALDGLGGVEIVSPTTLAETVQALFSTAALEPHIQYASLEHLKQMARSVLAGRFGPKGEQSEAMTGELFSGHLQERYPLPHKLGEPPVYKLRSALTAEERRWNVQKLRRTGRELLAHADALEAEGESVAVAA